MGVGRLAPHRVRERYAKALNGIPLPLRTVSGIAADALVSVGESEIAGRRIGFAILPGTPRLWITAPDRLPPVIGYVTGFESRRLDVHLTEPDHLEWVAGPGRTAALKRAAADTWTTAQRDCEG